MSDPTKTDDPPPMPPQLVRLLEEARQANIAATRRRLDEVLKMNAVQYLDMFDLTVMGDVAVAICGAQVCTISGNVSEWRWKVLWQGGNGNYTEEKISVERIFDAFDPERVNDKKKLEDELPGGETRI